VIIVGRDGGLTVGEMAAAVAVARAGLRRVSRRPGARGGLRRRGRHRPHAPLWTAAKTGTRRSPASVGSATRANLSHWEWKVVNHAPLPRKRSPLSKQGVNTKTLAQDENPGRLDKCNGYPIWEYISELWY